MKNTSKYKNTHNIVCLMWDRYEFHNLHKFLCHTRLEMSSIVRFFFVSIHISILFFLWQLVERGRSCYSAAPPGGELNLWTCHIRFLCVKIHSHTNFYDNRLNGAEVATLQCHLVASGIKPSPWKNTHIYIYIYIYIYMYQFS